MKQRVCSWVGEVELSPNVDEAINTLDMVRRNHSGAGTVSLSYEFAGETCTAAVYVERLETDDEEEVRMQEEAKALALQAEREVKAQISEAAGIARAIEQLQRRLDVLRGKS